MLFWLIELITFAGCTWGPLLWIRSRMKINPTLVDSIIAHANSSPEAEICGVVIGDTEPDTAIHLPNAHPRPREAFEANLEDVLEVFTLVEQLDMRIFLIYHSHIDTPAIPSKRDLQVTTVPGALYGIVSLLRPRLRLWEIDSGVAIERRLEIIERVS